MVNGQPGNTQSAFGVRHLFTGQQWYSELGLYDLRNRFYSPDIGRFLQPDPIGFEGDATNLYRYVGNNPVKWSDPSGLFAKQVQIPGITVSAGPVGGVDPFNTLVGEWGTLGEVMQYLGGGDHGRSGGGFRGVGDLAGNGGSTARMEPMPPTTIEQVIVNGWEPFASLPSWVIQVINAPYFGFGATPFLHVASSYGGDRMGGIGGHPFAQLARYNNQHQQEIRNRLRFADAMDQYALAVSKIMAIPVAVPAARYTATYLAFNPHEWGNFGNAFLNIPGDSYAPTTFGGFLGAAWHKAIGIGYDDSGNWHWW
jgi:RHS repeat-associated protein